MKTKQHLKFSEIATQHPLMDTRNLSGVVSYWHQKVNTYLLAPYMPMVNENQDKILVDKSKQARGGMTPMVHMSASSPIYNPQYGRGRSSFEAATFREKVRLGIDELHDFRVIGTEGEMETARNLMQDRIQSLEIRLANRTEWLRRQVLFEGAVTAEFPNGTTHTVNYAHPDYLEPTAGTPFTDYVNSDPVITIQDVIDDYELDTGRNIKDIILPHGMLRHFMQNQKFRDLAKQNLAVFRGTLEETTNLMVDLLGIGGFTESKDWIQFQSDLVADAAAGATTIVLENAHQLEAGERLYIASAKDDTRERFEVDSVTDNTVTLTTPIARVDGFNIGDPVKFNKLIIPENKILMFGEWEGQLSAEGELHPDKIQDPNRWGEVVSTRSPYADINNPRPGLYSRVRDDLDGDPPHLEYILGIRMLPRVTNPEGWLVLEAF